MQTHPVKDHEPSLLPEGNWELVWHDEFDGTSLNRETWDFRRSMMNHPSMWTAEKRDIRTKTLRIVPPLS